MVEQWIEPEPDWVPLAQARHRLIALRLGSPARQAVIDARSREARQKAIEAMIAARAAHKAPTPTADPPRSDGVQRMLLSGKMPSERAFDCAVSEGKVMIFARPGSLSHPFEQIGRDVWPVLKIVSWQNGRAVGPDETQYWSIHAKLPDARPADPNSETAVGTKVRATELDTAIKKCLLDLGRPPEDVSWCEFRDAVRDVCNGWKKDRKDGKPKRGYGDETIERRVKALYPSPVRKNKKHN